MRSDLDTHYHSVPYRPSEQAHLYGSSVHLLSDPYLLTRLARLCQASCRQPEINTILRELYLFLGRDVANQEFPKIRSRTETRMAEYHTEAVYDGEVVSRETRVVLADLARAGILPSMELFEMYSSLLDSNLVRIDHIFMNRTTDNENRVTGSTIHGSKIGGSVDGTYLIVPDPMGATGQSMTKVIQHYKSSVPGKPTKWISLNLIVTPEYIRALKREHPEVVIYAIRLDRAFSSERALLALPGEFPDEERGLNDNQYIVPGAGGLGELTSNSFV